MSTWTQPTHSWKNIQKTKQNSFGDNYLFRAELNDVSVVAVWLAGDDRSVCVQRATVGDDENLWSSAVVVVAMEAMHCTCARQLHPFINAVVSPVVDHSPPAKNGHTASRPIGQLGPPSPIFFLSPSANTILLEGQKRYARSRDKRVRYTVYVFTRGKPFHAESVTLPIQVHCIHTISS